MRPEHWTSTDLGAVVEKEGGLQTGPFGSQLHASDYVPSDSVPSGVPVIMPRDLAGNVISRSRASRVSGEKAAELERYRLRSGDILLARRGKIGRCAMVTREEEGWICGTGCLRARLAPTVAPEFLIQLLQWPVTVSWLVENAVGQTMKNLSTSILVGLPLNVPPLTEQKRIAEVLSSLDGCIAATRRVIDQAATIKTGFLRHLLSRGSSGGNAGIGTDGEALPAGWEWRPIGELCTFVNGHGFGASEWSDHGLPIIRIKNLNGSPDFKYFAGEPKQSWRVDPGDLLFAWAGVKGISFGPRIWRGPQGVLNQHIYLVRPQAGVAAEWLFETLHQVTRDIEERAQGFKSSLLHVRKADIAEHLVPVPPLAEQNAIAERSAFLAEMQEIERSNLEAQLKLKQALMSDLFTGRVTTRNLRRPHRGRPQSSDHRTSEPKSGSSMP